VSADRHFRTVPRTAPLLALVASLAMVLVVVQVPPCGMSAEACALAARPAPAAHCPMESAMGAAAAMDCCVGDAAPSREPAPAAPAPADDLRVQLKAPAPTVSLISGIVAALPAALPARAADATSTPPAVPLYTLLSTLLI
jgi:hypothetical protein